MRKTISFWFGLWTAVIGTVLAPAFAHAATTARINDTTVSDTAISLGVWLAEPSAYAGGATLTCTDKKTGAKFADTASPYNPGKYLLVCAGLLPQTTYAYTVVPADKTAFPALAGETTTVPKRTPAAHKEKYSMTNSTPTVSGFAVKIAVEVEQPVPGALYYMTLGTTSGGSTCAEKSGIAGSDKKETTSNVLVLVAEWMDLTPGNYCIGVWREETPGARDYAQGIAMVPGSAFTITKQGEQGSSFTPTANGYGCVSTDTSSYCPLAPLPGMGDAADGYRVDVSRGVGDYINTIIRIVLGAIGVLSVLMIVVGGIEYMATVNLSEKEGARERIKNALLGLLLALSSYLILRTLNPRLVDGGVTIPQANVQVQPDTFKRTSGGGTATGGGSTPNVVSNITTYDAMLKNATAQYGGIECSLLKAVMMAESGGNPNAKSGVGARGLVQLMPDTFQGLGFDPAQMTDPQTNLNAGAKFLSQLKKTGCNGSASNKVCNVSDWKYVIAGYNGGARANEYSDVCKKGQNIDTTAWQCTLNSGYAETRNYVNRVMGNWQKITANGWGC